MRLTQVWLDPVNGKAHNKTHFRNTHIPYNRHIVTTKLKKIPAGAGEARSNRNYPCEHYLE
ncbi:hypothetical protein [uncultured Gimesia sp.]|uniref:hypothetical protein n=1 Tax=uncultured Gimesia sp. TaxID=1678688 RepID=UPI002607651A|nr:hypothetical protein [uncultured Gimesia sp.]